jgi:hypothetical protein
MRVCGPAARYRWRWPVGGCAGRRRRWRAVGGNGWACGPTAAVVRCRWRRVVGGRAGRRQRWSAAGSDGRQAGVWAGDGSALQAATGGGGGALQAATGGGGVVL